LIHFYKRFDIVETFSSVDQFNVNKVITK